MPRSRVRRLATAIVATSFLMLAGLLSLWQQVDQACRSEGVTGGNVIEDCEATPIAEGPDLVLDGPMIEATATLGATR